MQFKLTALLAVAALVATVSASSQKAQECIQKCQYDRSDPECQQNCASDYLPEGGRGFQQMGSSYGGNTYPQGGFQGQSYGQSGYGQQYGVGHWQNGQWISGANGKAVDVAIPALAAVALGMMAL
ncbi:hypothetical protein Unana1_02318 [Umbelopsis nana]